MSLLFFRALCDMGIGFRFVMDEYFNQSLCQQSRCHISDGMSLCLPRPDLSSPLALLRSVLLVVLDEVVDEEKVFNQCAAPSGMIEFFELASEMWFFCVAFDLAVSITNPFSSFKARSLSSLTS
jgi:hypothetical protein